MNFDEYRSRPIVRYVSTEASMTFSDQNSPAAVSLDFPTKIVDSHNAVRRVGNTWRFVAPISGWYQLNLSLVAGNAFVAIDVVADTPESIALASHQARHPGWAEGVKGSALIHLKAGAGLEPQITYRFGAAPYKLLGGPGSNWIEILYVRES